MISKRTSLTFREYWANSRINYSVRVFIALVGVAVPCWWYDNSQAITPLVLGIIASALAETDDNFSGSFLPFSLPFSVLPSLRFPLNCCSIIPCCLSQLMASTFGFIMLGAIGPRYASIAFASLLIAVYTMLGAHASENIWYQPSLLLAGAAWYGVISLVWLMLWPLQPVQQSLAEVFKSLSAILNKV